MVKRKKNRWATLPVLVKAASIAASVLIILVPLLFNVLTRFANEDASKQYVAEKLSDISTVNEKQDAKLERNEEKQDQIVQQQNQLAQQQEKISQKQDEQGELLNKIYNWIKEKGNNNEIK